MEAKRYVVGLGEVLWDVLPEGKKLGGAPANFAYHAGQFLGSDNRFVYRFLLCCHPEWQTDKRGSQESRPGLCLRLHAAWCHAHTFSGIAGLRQNLDCS